MHDTRMNIGDFYGLAFFNSFQPFRINSTNFGPKTDTKDTKTFWAAQGVTKALRSIEPSVCERRRALAFLFAVVSMPAK